jgi:hypothetical protein
VTVLQDIDNFKVERAIVDAIRKDPQALALIDEVCHQPGTLGLALLCIAVTAVTESATDEANVRTADTDATLAHTNELQQLPSSNPDVPAAASIVHCCYWWWST